MKSFFRNLVSVIRSWFVDEEKEPVVVPSNPQVDLPPPFSPTIKVLGERFSFISVKALPVERRFFQRIVLKLIIQKRAVPQYTKFLTYF